MTNPSMLDFDALVSELDRMALESQALDLDILETDASMSELTASLESIDEIIKRIQHEGASREVAMVLEQHVEGILPKRFPVNSFTAVPSKTNYAVAMEAASGGKLALIVGVVAAIIAGIYKIIKWAIQLLRGSKNTAKAASKEAAQAYTANQTTNDIIKGKDVRGDLKFGRVDDAKIDEMRRVVFIEPAAGQMSKMALLLFLEKRPTLRALYSEVTNALFGKNDLITLTEQAIKATTAKIDQFVKASKADASVVNLEIVEYFEQPLRQVVYIFAEQGMLEAQPDFHGQKFSKVQQALTPVKQDQYKHVIANMSQILTSAASVKAVDDQESAALIRHSKFFSPEFYKTSEALEEIEKEAKWFFGNIAIPDDVDVKLSSLESALGDLKKSYDELFKQTHKDANAIVIARGMLDHIDSYQSDVRFLSKLAYAVRFLQRDVGQFFRCMTNGETACINYLKSLLAPESEGKFRDLIAEHRKAHASVISRFESYADWA